MKKQHVLTFEKKHLNNLQGITILLKSNASIFRKKRKKEEK
jgi:hypothetical protein